jgi:hypothetical protein
MSINCRKCYRRHKSWLTLAKCQWPRATWVQGNPPLPGPCFAVVSHCHPGCTVTLWATLAEAMQSKGLIDRLACGGGCYRAHRLLRLDSGPKGS